MYLSDPEYNNFFKTLSYLKEDFESDGMVFVDITEASTEDKHLEINAVVESSYVINLNRATYKQALEGSEDLGEDSITEGLDDKDLNAMLQDAEEMLVKNIAYIDALRNSLRIQVSSWLDPYDFEVWMIEKKETYDIGFNIRAFTSYIDQYNRTYFVYLADICPFEIIIP